MSLLKKKISNITFGRQLFVGVSTHSLTDDYDIIRQLGKGGYGRVYEVRNKKTQEIRACKHLSKLDIHNLPKFEKEIQILMQTDHPSIIRLFEVYESKKSLYLVMSLCKGGELFDKILDHIKSKKMYYEKDAAEIFLQIMSAIEYCHNKGIVHRDLKPENLLYLYETDEIDKSLNVIDFGLSTLIQGKPTLTSKVGTAYYVAPEILQGTYTEKCDIWSAGVILYILLSGEPPFNGPNDNFIYKRVMTMKYDFPEKKWGNITAEAKDLISHMLAPESERYSAKQVIAHPWFDKIKNMEQVQIDLDPNFMFDYCKGTHLKRVTLSYIASRLNDEDIKNLTANFKTFDKNKDGQISIKEFHDGIKSLNSLNISLNDLGKMFNIIDTDQNGKIDYNEFIAATMDKKTYLKSERLFEAFCHFDLDNSMKISKDELVQILKVKPGHEEEVDEIIKKADVNEDGFIDYREFCLMMGQQSTTTDIIEMEIESETTDDATI